MKNVKEKLLETVGKIEDLCEDLGYLYSEEEEYRDSFPEESKKYEELDGVINAIDDAISNLESAGICIEDVL